MKKELLNIVIHMKKELFIHNSAAYVNMEPTAGGRTRMVLEWDSGRMQGLAGSCHCGFWSY